MELQMKKSEKLISTPKSVKETRVAESPQEGYEAYLYKYTNLNHPLQKAYLGIHKGDYNDGYTNSSTSDEFKEVLASPESNVLYEVLEFGTYELMSVRENDILTMGREQNPDAWYNKTNGSPKFRVPKFDAINLLIKQIREGVFPITKMTREELVDLTFLQVRTEEHTDLKQDIAQSIDENSGDTSECEPIIVFEGRGKDGKNIGGDGNHTYQGGMSSEKMLEMPVIVIPLEENRHYSNTELKAFSNQMNAGDKIRKNPASKDDLKKQLLTMVVDAQDESVLDHPTVKSWLVNTMYVTKKKANGLIKSAKSQYQKDKGIEADKTWRHYTDKQFSDWVVKYEKSNENAIVIPINSNFVKYEKIMESLEMNLKRDKNGILSNPITPEKPQVTFLVRHKSSTHVDRWDEVLSKNLKTTIYPYLTLLGMKARIEVLPTQQVSDLGIFAFTNKEAA